MARGLLGRRFEAKLTLLWVTGKALRIAWRCLSWQIDGYGRGFADMATNLTGSDTPM